MTPASTDLDKLALKRKTPLTDAESGCVTHIALSEPVFVWNMDDGNIADVANKIKSRRCDFAARQRMNPNDGKSHLVLVECKRKVRGDDGEMENIRGQLSGGLAVLRRLAGDAGFSFDMLTPVLVSPNFAGGVGRALLLRFPIEYNHGRRARIRAARSGVVIDDKYVAVKGGKRRG